MERNKHEKGQTLVEILIAIAVMSMVLVSIASRAAESIRNANFARNQTLATRFSQQGIEWARVQRDDLQWSGMMDALDDGDPATYCVNDVALVLTASWADGPCVDTDKISGRIFAREITFDLDDNLPETYVDVNVQVWWVDSIGRHSISLDTRLSEWFVE